MRRAPGFTLVELLIAIALLALLAALSLRGLSSVLESDARVRAETRRWSELALVLGQLGQDLSLATARPEALAGGGLVIRRLGDDAATYWLRDGVLEYRVRESASPVLDNVAAFELRALGADGAWAPLHAPAAAQQLPRAVEAQLVLAGGERVSRVFLLR